MTQWEVTLAELLSDEGYSTAIYGKWHLGSTEGRYPTDQGFDEWYGIPNTTDESVYSEGFQYNETVLEKPYILSGVKGGKVKKVKEYNRESRRTIDGELIEKTVKFMERSTKDNNPFFAT